jgi:hypothetical protein
MSRKRQRRVDGGWRGVHLNYSKSKVEEEIATPSARLQGKMTGSASGRKVIRSIILRNFHSKILKNNDFFA